MVFSDIEGSSGSNCPYDALTIYVKNKGDQRIGESKRICGKSRLHLITREDQHIHAVFETDDSVTRGGFLIQYHETDGHSCGLSDLSASSVAWTHLTSPGYPSNYSNNLNCQWTISAPVGYAIKVEVVYFNVENSTACSSDYLLFSDGSTSFGAQLGKYCGRSYITRLVVSSRNYMTITFHTDGSDTALGFNLKYKAGYRTTTSTTTTTTTEITNGLNCSSPLLSASTSTWRYLSSPGYPNNNYNNNMECKWTISAPAGYKIKAEIRALSLEYEATCAREYLLFSDGFSSYGTKLGKYCTGTRDVVSSSNAMTITFHTDGSVTGRGFSLKYKTSGCGKDEEINNYKTKYIESPNYPLHYPNHADCSWTISTRLEGYVIHVKAVHFYLVSDHLCSYDFVQLYDVTGTYKRSLGRWCGSHGPVTQSTGMSMKVRFLSDSSNSFKGFKLAFTAVEPTSSSSVSPNYGGIIGGVIGGIVGVAIVTGCCCDIYSKKKFTPSDQSQRNRSREANLNTVYTVPPTTATTQHGMNTPPPAYSEVVKDDPPPYCQAVPQSDLQPVVTSSSNGASSYQGIDNPAGPS
ncbi:exoskeleton protein RP43-like [Haliotis rufescens]|uniref:exoskeleton protein RP43-like n=1 Tax=Haliotis rufescens TaxID=6454 RepID=UPI00201F8A09|nr:exoskeleton protein RP43-like [Haliotis rufescens]